MPIGKDSIQKRVAKVAPAATEEKTEEQATPAAKKPAARKPAAKKPATGKSAAPKAEPAKAETKAEPATAVMGNVAPETVEKVVGHAEKAPVEHVQIGAKMPTHLL